MYNKVIQLYIYIYLFLFRYFSHIGYYRILSRVLKDFFFFLKQENAGHKIQDSGDLWGEADSEY